MASPRSKTDSVEQNLQWLEEELERTKAQLHKSQSQMDQAVAQVRDMAAAVRRVEDNVGGFAGAASSVTAMQNDMRELKESISRLHDRQTEIATRTEDSIRQRQTDAEQGHNQRTAVGKQLEALDKLAATYDNRLHALDAAVRHLDDEANSLRQLQQSVARQSDEAGLKVGRQQDSLNRLATATERVAADIEGLHKQDDGLAERLRVQQEMIRRSEERVEQVARHLDMLQTLTEQQERMRIEVERQSERLAAVERTLEENTQHLTNVMQGMALLDQRVQTQSGRLLTVSQEMEIHRDQVKEQLTRMIRTLERQRRRQIEAMTQEIKEIRQSDLNYSGQQQP